MMRDWKVGLMVLGLFVGACDCKPVAEEAGAGAAREDKQEQADGVFKTIGNGLVSKALEAQGLGDNFQDLIDKRYEAADFGEEGPAEERVEAVAQPWIKGAPERKTYAAKPVETGWGLDENVTNMKGFFGQKYADLGRQIHRVKVMGAAHEAEIEISGGKVGDVVILMDVRGWVIARLALREDVDEARVSVKLEEKTKLEGIDRLWRFEVDGAEVVGNLSLYYRDTPVENWYEEGEDIGRVRDLVVKRVAQGGGLETLDARVNPDTERVEVAVRLSGVERFVVVY